MATANELGESTVSYAQALPIPSEILAPFLASVDKWAHNSGVPWTVTRCKGIYTDFVRYLAGEPPVQSWIKRSPNGLPKGVVGALYRFAGKGSRQTFAVITLLRTYTQWKASEPTTEQLQKFFGGVCAEDTPLPGVIRDGVQSVVDSLGVTISCGVPAPAWTYSPSDSKRVPCLDGTTKPESTHWQNQWLDVLHSGIGRALVWKYPRIFSPILGSYRHGYETLGASGKWIDSVGAIGLIQEPGYKLRAVANPNRIYQMALKPLGDSLFQLLKLLSWDCTHDQSKAIPYIQRALSDRKVVHCVDLSSATDFFPLSLQEVVLRSLVDDKDQDYVDLFVDLSRAPWRMKDTTVRWTKGQPLGLFPSFASFALTHGLLLLALNRGKHDNAFFVLGDDVVILDDSLYVRYVSALGGLGCPRSDAKSINSAWIAEFAGKLISRDRVYPQPKWRDMSDDNFLDVVRLLGAKALRLCRPRQKKVARAMWEIPDFCGGLGFNPRGKPLSERYYKYLVELGENDDGEYLMSLDERLNRFFNPEQTTGSIRPKPSWLGDIRIPDLDQKSMTLTLKYLPTIAEWFKGDLRKVLGRNLWDVVPGRDVLPQTRGSATRVSRLEVLERKLKTR